MKLSKGRPQESYDGVFLRYISSSALANLVIPVFSLFLPLLAVELGASILEIGLVGGAANAVYAFMPFVMGHFSDHGGARKFLIVISLALLSVVSTLYFFANSPVTLIVLRLFEGLGWAMFWPSIEAALTHDTTMDPRKVLTIFNFSWSSAAAIGPLFGSFIVLVLSVRYSFLASSFLLMAALVMNLIPILRKGQSPSAAPKESHAENTEIKVHLNPPRINPAFYILAMVVCSVSSGVLYTFFPPFGKSVGISILLIGTVSFVYGLCRFLGYLFTMREGFRHFLIAPEKRIRNTILSLVVLSLASLLVMIPDSSGRIYFVAFAIIGMCYSVVYSIALVAILAEARPEKMGASAGMFESSIGMGAAAGPIAAGIISGNSLSVVFIVPSLSLVAILPTMLLIMRFSKVRAY
ncbi:MAG: MFS transporter [Nitrososphaerales archaeon]